MNSALTGLFLADWLARAMGRGPSVDVAGGDPVGESRRQPSAACPAAAVCRWCGWV